MSFYKETKENRNYIESVNDGGKREKYLESVAPLQMPDRDTNDV